MLNAKHFKGSYNSIYIYMYIVMILQLINNKNNPYIWNV